MSSNRSEGDVEERSPTFEETLDALEQQREAIEVDFRKRADQLEAEARKLTSSVAEALEAARNSRAAAVGFVEQRLTAVQRALPESAGRAEWPRGGGFVRRRLNGLMRWVLRDYLETLDRRADVFETRAAALNVAIRELADVVPMLSRRPTGPALEAVETASSDAEAATRTGEISTVRITEEEGGRTDVQFLDQTLQSVAVALAALVEVQQRMLELVNAKDAEMLQRAAHGPLRRMELVFDEFGRQQEALLAELVGRRQELDALVERAKGAPTAVPPEN